MLRVLEINVSCFRKILNDDQLELRPSPGSLPINVFSPSPLGDAGHVVNVIKLFWRKSRKSRFPTKL